MADEGGGMAEEVVLLEDIPGETAAERYAYVAALHETTLVALEALMVARQQGRLTRAQYIELLFLEDRARLTAPQLVRLDRERQAEQAHTAMAAARLHHDSYIEPVTQAVQHIVDGLGQLLVASEVFVTLVGAQHQPLVDLRDPTGQPAFPALPDERMILQHLLGRLDQSGHLHEVVQRLGAHAPTVGEVLAGLDVVPGCRPFSSTLAQQYVSRFESLIQQAKEAA